MESQNAEYRKTYRSFRQKTNFPTVLCKFMIFFQILHCPHTCISSSEIESSSQPGTRFTTKHIRYSSTEADSPVNTTTPSSLDDRTIVGSTARDWGDINVFNEPLNLSVYHSLTSTLFGPEVSTITQNEKHSYSYSVNASILSRWSAIQLQFYAETENTTNSTEGKLPLLVTVQWLGSIRSWEIPVHFLNSSEAPRIKNRFSDLVVGKMLWNYPPRKPSKPCNLTVEINLAEEALVYYKLRIVIMKNFNAIMDSSNVGMATPASPAFFRLQVTPNTSDYFFLHVASDSDICATMSILQPRGPFLDSEDFHSSFRYSETFTMKTALTLQASNFPDGFLIVFIPFENDKLCRTSVRFETNTFQQENDSFRLKTLTFQIREGISRQKSIEAISIPLFVFFMSAILVLFMLFIFHSWTLRCLKDNQQKTVILQRQQSIMSMTDLIITDPRRVIDQTRRYCKAGLVTSAFYLVPVFQLILTFSKRLLETGNFDICYFNHFCSHSFGKFYDVNHMYSNVWYVLYGSLYIFIVYIRELTYETKSAKKYKYFTNPLKKIFPPTGISSDRGVMNHFGLLYSMGYSLIMTGTMSAMYHICPNQNNFQFDTVFMYTIAAITVVNIYQSRHPTYLSANFTFTALALVTCITVLGLLWDQHLSIRVVFSAIHFLFLILSLPKVCYNGYVRRNNELVEHWRDVMKILLKKLKDDWKQGRIFKIQRQVWHCPDDPDVTIIPGRGRLVLPSFLLGINCFAIAAMWTVLVNQNFATQVLFICVINGSLYTVFYSVLKLYHGECRRILWIQPAIYLLASFALWGYAMVYFFDTVSTWEDSPAESRLKNRDCILFSFYDSHDLWHFLSAAALFCSAMVLLTVDDDIFDQPKSSIPVF